MKPVSKRRALELVLEKFHALEQDWNESRRRPQQLCELKGFLASLDGDPALELHHVARLARHIHAEISLPHLCGLLVPVERAYERSNVTDADFLITNKDQPARESSTMPVTAVLDNIRSAFNVGGIFRTSECVGIRKLVLCGYTAPPTNAKVSRSALGTEEQVAWEEETTAAAAVERLRDDGCSVVALETAEEGCAPHACTFDFPCAVVLGNERFGLGQPLLAACDRVVRIPVYGRKNSLNVVAAFTVVAYELRRQWAGERGMENGEWVMVNG